MLSKLNKQNISSEKEQKLRQLIRKEIMNSGLISNRYGKTHYIFDFRVSDENGTDRYTLEEIKSGLKKGIFEFTENSILCDKSKNGKVVGQVEKIILKQSTIG